MRKGIAVIIPLLLMLLAALPMTAQAGTTTDKQAAPGTQAASSKPIVPPSKGAKDYYVTYKTVCTWMFFCYEVPEIHYYNPDTEYGKCICDCQARFPGNDRDSKRKRARCYELCLAWYG